MKARLLSLMLVLLMTLTLVPVGALAVDAAAGGQYCGKEGENLTWSLENGVLTIGGTGEMADYDENTPAPWSSDDVTSVVIQESVASIGANAFYFCGLNEISLPESLERIGAGAFSGCCFLSELTIPAKVEAIGEGAFFSCASLKNISVSAGNTVFASCDGVLYNKSTNELICCPAAYAGENCAIKEGTLGIANNAFTGCINIKSVSIPNSVKSLGVGAFSHCEGLTEAILPMGIAAIPDELFAACKHLSEVDIPGSVKTIGTGAFNGCTGLEKVSIPEGVVAIGKDAFFSCGIKELAIPGSVESIGTNAFGGLNAESVSFDGTSARWSEIGGNECGLAAEGVKFLGHEHIFGDEWHSDEKYHWHECSSCGAADVKKEHSDLGSETCAVCKARLPETLGEGQMRTGLTWKLTRSGVLSVSGQGQMPQFAAQESDILWSGYKSRIRAVVVESGVLNISCNAFSGCAALEHVSISDTVESIDPGALEGCPALAAYEVSDGNKSFASVDGVLFNAAKTCLLSYPAGRAGSSYTVPATVNKIGDRAFFACGIIENVELPDSVTAIGKSAFADCKKLKRAPLPEKVTVIDDRAFSGCTALEEAVIPDGVPELGEGVFSGCASITAVKIPEGITVIPDRAFCGCTALECVTIPKSVTAIGERAFSDCDSLKTINYLGSDSDWSAINIKSNNESLADAETNCTRIDHTHNYTDTVIPPTCTVRGSTVHTCSCGARIEDSFVDPLGHSYKNGACIRCKAPEPGSGGVGHVHRFEAVVTEPTCSSEGFTTYTCSCGEIYTKNYVAALAHVTERVNAKDAGCTEPGYTGDLVCLLCGSTTEKGETIPAAGHKFSGGVCSVCGEKQTQGEPVFEDVKSGDFYYDAVQWAVKKGVTKGTGKTTFSPEDNCTRFQIVMFLWRAFGCRKAGTTVEFDDVRPEDEFSDAVQWAAGQGITNGTGDGKFSPYATCTRAQIVAFLYRASGSPAVSGECTFADVEPEAYYRSAVAWASERGITNGTGDNMFSPDAVCTRAEAVTFLFRAFK